MRRHPLLAFVVLAYALTWALTIPFVYTWRVVFDEQISPWLALFLPAPFGPTFAALIMAWQLEGRNGVRRLLRRFKIWRVGVKPWSAALLLSPVVVTGAILASGAGPTVFARFHPAELAIVPLIWLGALPFGPLAEELGWRGWFLPRLQGLMTPLRASLVVGVVWTFWHAPMFWFPGAAVPAFLDLGPGAVLLYLAQLLGQSILMTALFNRSRGSVLLAIVYHAGFNTAETTIFRLFESPTEAQDPWIYVWMVALTWLAAALALALPRVEPVRELLPSADVTPPLRKERDP